jgi:hypothetical protein
MNRSAQKHLQSEIDAIVRSRPPSEWAHAMDMGSLYNSMVRAVMKETLGLMPPVINIRMTMAKVYHQSLPEMARR